MSTSSAEVKKKALILDMGGVIVQFKDKSAIGPFIELLRANPALVPRWYDGEEGRLPLSELVDFVEPIFPGIVSVALK